MDELIKYSIFEQAKNGDIDKFVGVNASTLTADVQSRYNSMMVNVRSAYKTVEDHVNGILTELTNVKGELATAEADFKNATDRVNQLVSDNATLAATVDKRDIEIASLIRTVDKAANDNTKLTDTITNLESEITKLKAIPPSTKFELFGKFVVYYTIATKNNETSRKILGLVTECYTTGTIAIECAISCMSLIAGQAAPDPRNRSVCITFIKDMIKGCSIPFALIRGIDAGGDYGIDSDTTMIAFDPKGNIVKATAETPYNNVAAINDVKNLK